jgi:hypothetical protein
MKQLRFILLAVMFFAASIAMAQEIPRRVIAAGGGQGGSGNAELSWTIGQAGLAGTLTHSSVILNTGFQQFDNLLLSTEEFLTDVSCTVFPNPFSGQFFLDISSPDLKEVNIRLFDNFGRLLSEQNFSGNTDGFKQTVKTQQLGPGMYHLLVTSVDKNNKTTKHSFKMIKH